jgi:hypothetical protein
MRIVPLEALKGDAARLRHQVLSMAGMGPRPHCSGCKCAARRAIFAGAITSQR